MHRFTSLLLIGMFFFSSCYQTAKIANQNLAFTYQKDAQVMHPRFTIFHSSTEKSQLHFSINTQELLYMKSPESSNYMARISVTYTLYSTYESKQVIDSSTVILEDDASKEENTELHGFLDFNATYPNRYVVEIILMDLNRNQSTLSYVEVDKSNNNTPQNFSLTNPKTNQMLFGNEVKMGEKISIMYNKNSAQKKLFIRYYKPNFPLPSPPFSVQNMQSIQLIPDSVFSLDLDNEYKGLQQLNSEGMYHFQSDTTTSDGLSVYVFHEDYPELTKAEYLVAPVRYITTKQEYETLLNNSNKKLAVDNFWIANCGTKDKAKAALKVYYNRVQNCNTFFTSYTEGWKTDRGLIYIAFGLPNSIYRDSNGETWTYGEEQNYRALTFVFNKVVNPHSSNDYSLVRSENYRNDWFRMIDAWRQGKIVNEK